MIQARSCAFLKHAVGFQHLKQIFKTNRFQRGQFVITFTETIHHYIDYKARRIQDTAIISMVRKNIKYLITG